MTLYELNQAGYHSLPSLTEEGLEDAKNKLYTFLESNEGEFFMLLCNELRYYTIFNFDGSSYYSTDQVIDDIFNLIENTLGIIKAVEINGGIIEFWVSNMNGCNMYAFFNYDEGVIKY